MKLLDLKARDFSSPIAALFQPVDFLYKLFGKKPKQLKNFKKLKKKIIYVKLWLVNLTEKL